MSDPKNTPENAAARALELLEQSYAYYSQPLSVIETGKVKDETYYEYVKAA
ncbi:hypothetical protein [Shimia biformata]|uniref:hypothetical protein n=1 Tax=Shimia biformata TaxID=1294299 RepID=UPI001950CD4C|nr:hypothetical protein [Shimia biformata]